MKPHSQKYFKIILTLLLVLSNTFLIDAAEYGRNKNKVPYRYQVPQGQSVKVRKLPDTKNGQRIFSVNHPDYIYVDDDQTYDGSGYKWIRISGDQGYVALKFLLKVHNPYYSMEEIAAPPSIDLRKTHEITQWVLIALIIGLLIYGCFTSKFKTILSNFWGVRDENNMRRLFFFNHHPYTSILQISLYTGGAVLSSVLSLLLFGLAVFVLFWIIKILLIIIVWVGIIGCVIGILGCFAGAFFCIIFVAIGGLIWYHSEAIENFAEALVNSGLSFFQELNLISFVSDIFMNYWGYGLAIILTPMTIFIILAVISLLFAGTMMLIEWIVTARYNIKHPCPSCHRPSEPAIYLSQNTPLPVKLRPGPYGLFKIKHPDTGEEMPTMLFNGRHDLPRECPHCHNTIRAKVGEEKHITMVGLPQAGKTTLIYRMIGEVIRESGEKNVEFTDKLKDSIRQYINSIVQTGKAESVPDKTSSAVRHNSIQLLVHRPGLALPYRLYINDVAGELFTTGHTASSLDKVPFFSNTQSIIFLIDPYTTYFGNLSTDPLFQKWYTSNVGDIKDKGAKINIEEAFTNLKNIIESKGRKTKEIHLNLVLAKKDTGYLNRVNIDSEAAIKNFVENDLDMSNYIHDIESNYASVSYHAVSAMEDINNSNIKKLYTKVFEQINLKLK